MANMSQDLDFDLFNGADEVEDDTALDTSMEAPIDELDTSGAGIADESTTPSEEATPEEDFSAESDNTSEVSDEDIDALVQEILGSAEEVDDKVEEVKAEAESTGNEELLGMIDELQNLIAEKNLKIDELTKKNEITSNRYMNSYGDAENYSFYKPTIEKLDNNPQLSMLVKNYDNEASNERVVEILADMIKEKTGVDVNDAINAQQKNSVGNALTGVGGSGMDMSPVEEKKETPFTREQSLTELF